MKVHSISSHRKPTDVGVVIHLTAKVSVQPQAAERTLFIESAEYFVMTPEDPADLENEVKVNEDEELWDFRYCLVDMGASMDEVNQIVLIRNA